MSKDDFTLFKFPIVRREEIPDPYYGERCCYEPGICMREACGLPRNDNSVLCEEHTQEVYDKKAKAPSLIPHHMRQPVSYPSGALFYMDFTKNLEESKKKKK